MIEFFVDQPVQKFYTQFILVFFHTVYDEFRAIYTGLQLAQLREVNTCDSNIAARVHGTRRVVEN